ncbi:MAG: hypothetical protein MJY68_02760 [Bacteroidaceae bacterium]|nr:hypothetical protein [Bacteroidaceae bacterium]
MPFRKFTVLFAALLACLSAAAGSLNDSVSIDTLLLDDGTLYRGRIRDSVFNGQGTCIYADGTVYEGEWKDGLWNGKGTVIYPDGDIYNGTFRNHIKEGKGTYTYHSGARYNGEWKDDKFNGKGKLYFADGGMYDGAWKDDMKHGYGTLITYDGKAIIGYFYRDEYLGMPENTEIDSDSTMTDELIKWGFRQEDPQARLEVQIGASYGSKGMLTFSLLFNYTGHAYYGTSIGFNIEPPTRGTATGGIGFLTYTDDIHFKGDFISLQYLIDAGYSFGKKKFSIGGALGVGIRSAYMNCKANGSPDRYETYQLNHGEAYSRTSTEGLNLVGRGYMRYSFGRQEKPKARVYLGYGIADGLFLGASWYLR